MILIDDIGRDWFYTVVCKMHFDLDFLCVPFICSSVYMPLCFPYETHHVKNFVLGVAA